VSQKQIVVFLVLALAASSRADEAKQLGGLTEPVYRVTKQDTSLRTIDTTVQAKAALAKPAEPHPLDAALSMAKESLSASRNNIEDYTAILIKRERIGGELKDHQFMQAKIRNRKLSGDQVTTPFSVYLKFLKPDAVKGREVIYVEGQNNGNLVAHEGGWKGKFTPSLHLNPHGTLAMLGQRYPITDIGIENLCVRLIEKGQRDKELGRCEVDVQPVKLNKRPCTRIQVTHPHQRPELDFHVARIFVDDEYEIPVRYEAYRWPRQSGNQVTLDELIEEYTYVYFKANVGLSDKDFDPANPEYNMQ
jgi:hypothetical protein